MGPLIFFVFICCKVLARCYNSVTGSAGLVQLRKDREMRKYIAFYRGRHIELEAPTSYDAQLIAAKLFKARKSYEVTVMLADVVHSPAVL